MEFVPLLPVSLAIIQKYQDHPLCKKTSVGYYQLNQVQI